MPFHSLARRGGRHNGGPRRKRWVPNPPPPPRPPPPRGGGGGRGGGEGRGPRAHALGYSSSAPAGARRTARVTMTRLLTATLTPRVNTHRTASRAHHSNSRRVRRVANSS